MTELPRCNLCNQPLGIGAHYIVRIDVFADPSVPAMTTEAADAGDQSMSQLLKEIEQLSADELQDQVYRRFEYKLCRTCQLKFLANPLGLPRAKSTPQQETN